MRDTKEKWVEYILEETLLEICELFESQVVPNFLEDVMESHINKTLTNELVDKINDLVEKEEQGNKETEYTIFCDKLIKSFTDDFINKVKTLGQ